jgi:hypothetical protein
VIRTPRRSRASSRSSSRASWSAGSGRLAPVHFISADYIRIIGIGHAILLPHPDLAQGGGAGGTEAELVRGRGLRGLRAAPGGPDRARSHCRFAPPTPLHTRFTNKFGTSIPETTTRPNPRPRCCCSAVRAGRMQPAPRRPAAVAAVSSGEKQIRGSGGSLEHPRASSCAPPYRVYGVF